MKLLNPASILTVVALAAVLIGGFAGTRAHSVSAAFCADSAYSGDASAKLNQVAQPDYVADATLAFDSACLPDLAVVPTADPGNPAGTINGAISIDTSTGWTVAKTSADTWKATLKTTGAHGTVVVGGVPVNMKLGAVVTFKVTSAGDLYFKASGFAASGQAFETQSKGLGLDPS